MTFDLRDEIRVSTPRNIEAWNRWKIFVEVFCICKRCFKPTIFLVAQKKEGSSKYFERELHTLDVAVNEIVDIMGHIGPQHFFVEPPPKHLPKDIEKIFIEGSKCMAVSCHNAAATMFRLCLDLATKSLPLKSSEEMDHNTKRSLGLRLTWLFDKGELPEDLRDLSTCIKDDGNDGAHEGTLSKKDAVAILEFTAILLNRLYTQKEEVRMAEERRGSRKRTP